MGSENKDISLEHLRLTCARLMFVPSVRWIDTSRDDSNLMLSEVYFVMLCDSQCDARNATFIKLEKKSNSRKMF